MGKDTDEILRCPVGGSGLRRLDSAELGDLNEALARDGAEFLGGGLPRLPLEAALVAEDGTCAYEEREGILMLLEELAIPLTADAAGARAEFGEAKRGVQDFYDGFGWTRDSEGSFRDSSIFAGGRPATAEYLAACRLRTGRHIAKSGRYLLDVASGPVAFDEYLTYSEGYERRVCVDLSARALREAKTKLGESGVYILGDITNLPIRDNVCDGAVSVATIYHVPAEEQAGAFREIHRVLCPGARASIVYSWGDRSPSMLLMRGLKFLLVKLPRKAIGTGDGGESAVDTRSMGLYFHAHGYRWFEEQGFPFQLEIYCQRSLSNQILDALIHPGLFGEAILRAVFRLEDMFPRLAGRLGEHCLIAIEKAPRPAGQ